MWWTESRAEETRQRSACRPNQLFAISLENPVLDEAVGRPWWMR